MTSPFDLGVASFDPLPDRVLLWTRIDGGGDVTWEVATDPDLRRVVAAGQAAATEAPWTVTVDAGGLDPATTYWYRFTTAAGVPSPVGRTRTLPGAGTDRVRLGVVCCARYSQSTFAVYRALAAGDVDLVVHLGDYVYEDAKAGLPGREPDPPHDAVSLDDYRTRHLQHRRDPDLQALHAAHPMVAIWDDHDIADNAWSGGAKSHDDGEHGPWHDRLLAATRAHDEFVPKRLADPDDPRSAWRCFDAGGVRLICTETRAFRDRQAGLGDGDAADDPDRTMLGTAQRRWLEPLLADPAPGWLLLASGTVMSELEVDVPEELDGLLPEKYAVVDGHAVNTDQWDGYRAERRVLAGALARRGRANVVLSGDIHSAWAIEGPAGPDGEAVAVELTCPPAATTPIGQLLPAGGGRLGPLLTGAFDGARWVDADHHGYLVLDVATDRLTATYWWVDPAGDGRPTRGAVLAVLPDQVGRLFLVGVPDHGAAPDEGDRRWGGGRRPLGAALAAAVAGATAATVWTARRRARQR